MKNFENLTKVNVQDMEANHGVIHANMDAQYGNGESLSKEVMDELMKFNN